MKFSGTLKIFTERDFEKILAILFFSKSLTSTKSEIETEFKVHFVPRLDRAEASSDFEVRGFVRFFSHEPEVVPSYLARWNFEKTTRIIVT